MSVRDTDWSSAGGAHTACNKFPEYMAKNNYQLTNDVKTGPYQFAFNTEMSMFEWMNAHQPLGLQFNHHMGGYRQGRPSWMDANFYPVNDRLVESFDSSDDSVLLVDVGGSLGHDIEEFRYADMQISISHLTIHIDRNFPMLPAASFCRTFPSSSTLSKSCLLRSSA
jgi:hypothetical protein